jgi:RNA polymerase sigma-70 factor (ECF subfamily)
VIANQRRGERRRTALGERLAANVAPAPVQQEEPPSELSRAFASLSDSDRELLSLVAWEGLTPKELSVALETSTAVVRLRLHRARKRLREALPQTHVRFSGGREHEWT